MQIRQREAIDSLDLWNLNEFLDDLQLWDFDSDGRLSIAHIHELLW